METQPNFFFEPLGEKDSNTKGLERTYIRTSFMKEPNQEITINKKGSGFIFKSQI